MKKTGFLFLFLILFAPHAHAQQACNLNATPSNFAAQLAAAQSGQTLCLASGNYAATSGKSGVTILAPAGTAANIAGGSPVSGARFVGINWTAPVCISGAQNVLIDQSRFVGLGQGCNEGRLGLRGNGSGTVISNSLFQGGASDGIQFTGGATGYHIGPGNIFRNILQGGCGSVHCDALQFYGGSNNVIDGNWFDNDSTIVMSPDCNGSPMTFTNNVVNQEAGSAAAALTLGGTTSADLFAHNTMLHGSFRVYPGNPGNCSTGGIVRDNLTSFGGVVFVGGSSPTTWSGFALAPGSAGIGAASDGLDLGINVSGTLPAPTPTPMPTPSGPQVGNRVSVNSTANIRATAVNNGFGALYGTEPAGALGTVLQISTAIVPGTNGATWVQVKFDSCGASIPNCTGWMGGNNMTVVSAPPPPPPPAIMLSCANLVCAVNPSSIPSGTSIGITASGGGASATSSVTVP